MAGTEAPAPIKRVVGESGRARHPPSLPSPHTAGDGAASHFSSSGSLLSLLYPVPVSLFRHPTLLALPFSLRVLCFLSPLARRQHLVHSSEVHLGEADQRDLPLASPAHNEELKDLGGKGRSL